MSAPEHFRFPRAIRWLVPPESPHTESTLVPMAKRANATVPLLLAGYSAERMAYEKHFQFGTPYSWLVAR